MKAHSSLCELLEWFPGYKPASLAMAVSRQKAKNSVAAQPTQLDVLAALSLHSRTERDIESESKQHAGSLPSVTLLACSKTPQPVRVKGQRLPGKIWMPILKLRGLRASVFHEYLNSRECYLTILSLQQFLLKLSKHAFLSLELGKSGSSQSI